MARRAKSEAMYAADPATGCWNWLRASKDGRGRIRRDGRLLLAYRWLYEELVGPIPDGLTLDHLCENPRCVNPAHMEPVPLAVNGRRATSALTPDDVRRARRLMEGGTVASVARLFGVDASTMSKIKHGHRWANA